ncbi:MAG: diaminopimelate decarboxylase [Elusimicrobiota bacterium]
MFCEGVALERIARSAGTPVYVYSAAAVLGRYRELDHAFAGRERAVCYALKANPNAALCRLLSREGAGADVVSGGELQRALAAGFPPDRILFSGAGKTEAELRLAVRSKIAAVNVESRGELDLLARVARRLRRRAPVGVRLNPGVGAGAHAHIQTGDAATKFGVPAREAGALLMRCRADRWLRPVGLQCHIGSQIEAAGPYRKALGELLGVLVEARRKGVELEHADIGGGMGIAYPGARSLLPSDLARAILPALKPHPRLRLILEPGRWLVGEAGVLLTRVLYRKEGGGRRFLIVDAGMNDLMRPALYGARHGIAPVRLGKGRASAMDIVGPVCETGDYLARGVMLPGQEPGALLAVLQAGAYGFSMSSQYNSRPRAAEALVEGRSWRVVRERESLSDVTRGEKP